MKQPVFRNIILISMDATSPQRLSCYGSKAKTTPQIDQALSEGGAIFKNAFSQAPYTDSSHASMLTSLYPFSHNVNDWRKAISPKLTLASALKQSGFATAGFTNHPCLSRKYGFDTGFDTFARGWRIQKLNIKRDLPLLNKALREILIRGAKVIFGIPKKRGKQEESCDYGLRWIRRNRKRRFFLFVHLFSAQPHYNAPAPFAGLFLKGIPDKFKDIRIRDKQWDYQGRLDKYSQEEKNQLIDLLGKLHDEEIAYNDNQVGALIAVLKKLNIYKDTLIILTSDHGNFLHRLRQRKQRACLFDDNIHVPLIFVNPSLRPKRNIECLAQVIDIFPTAVSFTGKDIPAIVQGKDLKEAILHNSSGPHRYIYANYRLFSAIRSMQEKFIYDEEAGRTQLYDLVSDPEELNNLSSKLPDKIETFLAEYKSWKEKTLRYGLAAEEKPLSKYEAEQLRALGYIA